MFRIPVLTLLTDFGLQDGYVGVMKGVILQIDPTIQIIDLTHQIPPQDIAAARFNLMNAYSYFPKGTVHVAVVDPGVGGSRRAIAVELEQCFLVGPDNGLFSGVLSQVAPKAVVELTNSLYWRTSKPSSTFHGRDIFAPVGAHLAQGVALSELGRGLNPKSLVQLPLATCSRTEDRIRGCIQYIDRFGNLVTNISGGDISGKRWSVEIAQSRIAGRYTYGEVASGELLALVGSHGWLEIALNRGSAQAQLNLRVGDRLMVLLDG